MLPSPPLLTWQPLPAEHRKSHCASRTRAGGQRGRKGWSGRAALSLSHGSEWLPESGPLSTACPACSAPGWAEALPAFSSCQRPPTRGAHSTAGVERAEARSGRPAVAKCKHSQRHHQQSRGRGRGRGLVHKEGVGIQGGTQPLGLSKQNKKKKKKNKQQKQNRRREPQRRPVRKREHSGGSRVWVWP